MDLGIFLRQARHNVPLSLNDAATKLGLSITGLRKLESNITRPSFDTLSRIIELYRIDPRLLFPGDWDTEGDSAIILLLRELGLPARQSIDLIRELNILTAGQFERYFSAALAHFNVPASFLAATPADTQT